MILGLSSGTSLMIILLYGLYSLVRGLTSTKKIGQHFPGSLHSLLKNDIEMEGCGGVSLMLDALKLSFSKLCFECFPVFQHVTTALTLLQKTEFSIGNYDQCILQAEILLNSSSHELPRGCTHMWSEIMERPDAGLE